MPTLEQIHDFLKSHYKHDRLEGRNNSQWDLNYSKIVAQSHLDDLNKHGSGWISRHESNSGNAIKYNSQLQII